MNLLPFNFELIDKDVAFLSNVAGFHEFLPRGELYSLINTGSTNDLEKDGLLERKLFAVSDGQDLASVSALSSGFSKRLMKALEFNPIFMIVPTLRCDHTCNYCQVSRAAIGASNYDLDPELIPVLIQRIRELSKAPYKIEIQGGEPLLRFDLVKKIYEEAVSQLGADEFEFVITTSLSLLDDEILSWSKENPVQFSTSLDGSKFIHNSNRIIKNGSSFDLVKSGIEKIKHELGLNRVATVTTVTSDLLKHSKDIVDAHVELELSEMFVRPISPYGFADKGKSLSYTIESYMTFYEKLLRILSERWAMGDKIVEHSALIHLKRIFDSDYNGYADLKSPSGLILNSILFNYDGRIYGSDEARMLQKTNPKIDFSLGTIEKPEVLFNDLYKEIIERSFSLFQPGCSSCAFQPFCGSDPCQNISVFGEPIGDKSFSLFCQYHKSMFSLITKHIQMKNSPIRDMFMEWMDE